LMEIAELPIVHLLKNIHVESLIPLPEDNDAQESHMALC
jgi:hypothetical protein